AELADDPGDAHATVKRALRTALAVGGLGVAIVLVAAGPVLGLLGHQYAAQGAAPLRILALAVFPLTATAAYFASCRAMGRIRVVGVACHRRRSGRLAVVEAFGRGSGLGLLALSGRRVMFAGQGGMLELPRSELVSAETHGGRFGTQQLRLNTTAGEVSLDGL